MIAPDFCFLVRVMALPKQPRHGLEGLVRRNGKSGPTLDLQCRPPTRAGAPARTTKNASEWPGPNVTQQRSR
jgi:hypothetical protein